jgi:hypothetical protein
VEPFPILSQNWWGLTLAKSATKKFIPVGIEVREKFSV